MYDDLKIIIKSVLDESSQQINSLNAQIKAIANRLEPLKLKIDLQIDSIKQASESIKQLQTQIIDKASSELNRTVKEAQDALRKVEVYAPKYGDKLVKEVTIYRDSLATTRQVIKQYNDEQKKLVQTAEILTTDWEKQNKVIAEVQKNIRVLQTRIELLRRQYNLGDFSELDKFAESLDIDKIDLSNYKQQIAELKNQYQLIADTVQRTHRENVARLKQEVELEEQKNAAFMRNWVRQLEIDAEMRRLASERIKAQMQNNALEDERIKKLQQQIELAKQDYQIRIAKLKRDYAGLYDEKALAGFVEELNKLSVDTPDVSYKLRQMALQFKTIEQNARSSKKALDLSNRSATSLGRAFETALTKFSIWITASTVFYQSLRFFTHGIEYVNELNKVLTEISIVTGQSQHQVALLAKEYQELAKQMGVTTEEVARGAVEFYRQGLSQEEVMERMRVTTMAAKISAQDFRTTAELLTAAVNSMNVSIERASDVFAYLGKVHCPLAA